jgi:thiol-disulfide isomerase/thioredoxin
MSSKRAPVRPVRQVRKPVSKTPQWVLPVAVVACIAVVIAAFLVIRWYMTPLPPKPLPPDTTQVVVTEITSLPVSEFDSVGQGTANNLIKPIAGSPLIGPSGKPEVFYFGAEYCPYCAAERWPLIIALGRFGTWSNLKTTSSSSTDIYPNTPTFTFHGASYTSQYIDFAAVETTDRNQNPLESPTPQERDLVSKYDTANSIPFVDFGNRYAFSGAMYLPDVLNGEDWQTVANQLQQSNSKQALAIIGSANLITAAVCKITGNQPTAVCSSQTIQSLETKL